MKHICEVGSLGGMIKGKLVCLRCYNKKHKPSIREIKDLIDLHKGEINLR